MEIKNEEKNYVKVNLTKSSSKEGNLGYTIEVKCSDPKQDKELLERAENALNTALQTEKELSSRR